MGGLGEMLRRAREERGLSLDTAAEATKIRKAYLQALELEEFQELPAPVFAKGFLRRYAQYLELGPEKVCSLYPYQDFKPALGPLPSLPRPSPGIGFWFTLIVVFLLVASGGFYLYSESRLALPATASPVIELTTVVPGAAARASPTPTPFPSPAPPTPSPTPRPTLTPSPPDGQARVINLPSFLGMSYAEAEGVLKAMGLLASREEAWNAGMARGVVYEQRPAPGQAVLPGSTVLLRVSKGPERAVVPDVVGLPEAAAQRKIQEAGLRNSPWVNYQGHDKLSDQLLKQVCVGCVLSTEPKTGEEVDFGTVVNMAVRKD